MMNLFKAFLIASGSRFSELSASSRVFRWTNRLFRYLFIEMVSQNTKVRVKILITFIFSRFFSNMLKFHHFYTLVLSKSYDCDARTEGIKFGSFIFGAEIIPSWICSDVPRKSYEINFPIIGIFNLSLSLWRMNVSTKINF